MNGFVGVTRKSSIKREFKALMYTWMENTDLELWVRYFICFVIGYITHGVIAALIEP